ncbi:MAG: Omp28-related outer membrane protein [Bacteroidia bacterium]
MKKLLVFTVLLTIAFTGCKKDSSEPVAPPTGGGGTTTLTVQKKNRALLMDFTATWCGPCGQYGGPAFDGTLVQEGLTIAPMKLYATSSTPSSMGHPFYSAMSSAFGISGIPSFRLNNASVSTSTNAAINAAATFQNDTSKLIAGVALSKVIEGDSIKVKTKIKFFKSQNAGSDYKIALYVVEDNIISPQLVGSTTNNTYDHRNILRASNSSTYSGVSFNSSAAILVNQEFDKTYSIYLNPAWNKANLKVIATIWKGGTTPTVINSNISK